MGAALETELKLRADEGALTRLAAVDRVGPADLGPPSEVDEIDVYLDTADGRLAAARWACRLRTRGGERRIALKGPAEHRPGDAVHRRPEVNGPAPGGDATLASAWPPSAARDLVLRLAGDAPLVERLALRQRRIERAVAVDGDRVGTLSLDRVTVLRGGVRLGSFGIVELELSATSRAAAPWWLDAVAGELEARYGLEPEPSSKLERALALAEGPVGADR